jgi:hypothetical protein
MAGHKIIGKFFTFSLILFTRDVAITSDGVVSLIIHNFQKILLGNDFSNVIMHWAFYSAGNISK